MSNVRSTASLVNDTEPMPCASCMRYRMRPAYQNLVRVHLGNHISRNYHSITDMIIENGRLGLRSENICNHGGNNLFRCLISISLVVSMLRPKLSCRPQFDYKVLPHILKNHSDSLASRLWNPLLSFPSVEMTLSAQNQISADPKEHDKERRIYL